MNILIVDNCEGLRDFCSLLLKNEGHKIFPADNHTFFDRFIESNFEIDLVILNANPLDTDPAKEIVKITKSVDNEIPIIILSVNWYNEVIDALIKQGCINLTVPFEAEQLIEAVKNISYCPVP